MRLIKSKVSFWTEANYLTKGARKHGSFKFLLRRFILNSADGYYFIPGEMSLITLKKWDINFADRYIMLPNLPHKSFDDNVSTWKGSSSKKPVFTIVARLYENHKGIKNFMEKIGLLRLKGIILNIIGSGEDHLIYEKYITDNNLHENIYLLGSLSIDDILDKLKTSDVFLIPSFSDPSPLVLIEACKIGLPLLVSNCCGNHYECILDNKNGYLFDPYDTNRRPEWINFSRESVDIARNKFNTEEVLRRLSSCL
jgi:glycosyltransferase involved in cell wall biosynthesis